jgi:hypothetical protein
MFVAEQQIKEFGTHLFMLPALIMAMQAAHLRDCDYLLTFWRLHGLWHWENSTSGTV